MLIPVLVYLQTAAGQQGAASASRVFSGWRHETTVIAPRLDAEADIDGELDEPMWRQAAVLNGFSMYQPIDGQPAPDSTEVLVWYSPNAIYFGIRAFEAHGLVRATLSDRDFVGNDDNVELHLDTFHQLRRAYVFIVNALGVQADGIKNEDAGLFAPGQTIAPGQTDLNPDFIWQSKGHLTPWGYQVEVRIPFKSLRFPALSSEDWGIQIVRNVQHSAYAETWTPAVRASASFIVQEGTIVGMSDMRHGEVIELNPEITTSVDGAPAPAPVPAGAGAWTYRTSPTLGGNVKWGVTSNFVLNATVKPDFSQVEADALQIAGDARFQVFYPEKRPFFEDGIEQFNIPNNLVYTRQIVHPTAAAKVFGRVGRTDIALLSALDDPETSLSGHGNPAWNIVRLKRDFAAQSFTGLTLTDREDGGAFNRLLEGDVHHVFGRLYYFELQGAESATRQNDSTRSGPMWEAAVDRTGRSYGFHYQVTAFDPHFQAYSGFVPRTNYVDAKIANRYTLYGSPGGIFEALNSYFTQEGLWRYGDFFRANSLLEDHASVSSTATLHGGWKLGVTPTISSYAFDPSAYAADYVLGTAGAYVPFQPSSRIPTLTLGTSLSTPQFQHVIATIGSTVGNDVDFFETSRVRRLDYSGSVDWRPNAHVRVDASYQSSRFTRLSDDAIIRTVRIPRLDLEYQLTRAIFLRVVGQYDANGGTPLVDPHSGAAIYTDSSGVFSPATHFQDNGLRVDWLLAYQPTPGTVFFAGYGSSLTEDYPLRFDRLHRLSDGFFLKGSYLLRR